jgi:hypothetical protein
MSPIVGYSKVKKIIGDNNSNIGSTEYLFKNMEGYSASSIGKIHFDPNGPAIGDEVYYDYNVVTVQDNRSMYGRLLSITNLDNNENVITKTSYEYHDHITDPRGMVDEVFYDYDKVSTASGTDFLYKKLYWKQTFNTHLKKEITYKDGITTTLEYTKRNNFTGIPTETVLSSPTLNSTTEVDFAYETYTNMGAKTTNPNYDNILVGSKEERIHPSVGGSTSEWDNILPTRIWDAQNNKYITSSQSSIWSPIENSTYNGYVGNNFIWKKLSTNSLFSGKNGESLVEQKDMKDRYAATKYGYDDRFKIAEVSNCNYASFAFSSFESTKEVEPSVFHYDGEVQKQNETQVGATSSVSPHTGNFMVEISSGTSGPIYHSAINNTTINNEDFERGIQVGRTYLVSVWVHESSPIEAQLVCVLDGNTPLTKSIRKDSPEGLVIGEWIQLNIIVSVPDNYTSSAGNDFTVYIENPGNGIAYFDDLVIHPVDAPFTGYIYDERLGLIKAVVNNENFYTRFEHDNAGNIIKTYKETRNGEKIISTSDYNFK